MKSLVFKGLLVLMVLLGVLSGCTSSQQVAQPTATIEVATIQPTNTVQPTNTAQPTNTPQPTPLPGKVVFPINSLDYGIPWMPLVKSKTPMLVAIGFNVNNPPFNVPEVRQAFTAALDTEVLTIIYQKGAFYNDEKSTRTIIPPEVLSMDVSGEIGIPYNPELAKQLLVKAGYEDPSSFPEVNLLVPYLNGQGYPGLIIQAMEEAIKMWQDNLGVSVKLEVVSFDVGTETQTELIKSGQYDLFEYGVWGDNDPNSFVYNMFHPEGERNLNGFDSARITKLINDSQNEVDPAKRLPIYLEMERLLSEQELPIIPLFHCTVDFDF